MSDDFAKLITALEKQKAKLEAELAPALAEMEEVRVAMAPYEETYRKCHNIIKKISQGELLEVNRKLEALYKASQN